MSHNKEKKSNTLNYPVKIVANALKTSLIGVNLNLIVFEQKGQIKNGYSTTNLNA
jgi:hypothetical protein